MHEDEKPTEKANWSFHKENDTSGMDHDANPHSDTSSVEPVSWTASEFIAHQKDPIWYGAVMGFVIVLCGGIYMVTQDIVSIVAIVAVVLLFIIVSAKKPEQKAFTVDHSGVSIGDKFYSYSLYKSFAVQQEGAIGSVSFMPLKRLMPEVTIYFAPEDEDRIVDVLSASLPNDQRPERSGDKLMRRLHF